MANEKQYRYNDITERYGRMNSLYIIAASCLWVMFLVYLLLKIASNSIAPPTGYGNILFVAAFFGSNWFIYFRSRKGTSLKKVIAVEIGIEFLLLGMQTEAEFIYYAVIGILLLQIPYYDMKNYKRLCVSYTVFYTVVLIIRYIKFDALREVDGLCRTICIYLIFLALYQVGSIARQFSEDALGFAEEQGSRQKAMLERILDTCQTVQEESERSRGLVDELVGATQRVAQSMQEISAASGTTAESIEEQNTMTQSIQEAIGETGEHSKKMVEIATDSNKSIQENLQVMEELKGQSVQIAETNHEVTESMGRLQGKTKEVESIAGMILDISSQTNLLALNASIESARAGEAGRGFAVVAEQIRQLAEQTRTSTEEITGIINELNKNADEVVKAVESSVDAAKSQNKKILSAADSFEKLNVNMTELIQTIHEIDGQIGGLSESNNRIVENISHLSAATEEVTASAEQVHQMSEQNLNYAEQVKDAIGMIQEKSDGMQRYM